VRRAQPSGGAPLAVRIVTDSACDLAPELCAELGIEVVSLSIRFGEQEFQDRTELTVEEFWAKLPNSPQLPETAAPSVGAFEETFRRLADEGADGIVCINLSSKMSATMQSAQLAAKALDGLCPIAIIDSKNATMGLGLQVIHAARQANSGADMATIVADAEERRERIRVFATVDTLEYLKKGGRLTGAQALVGSMLSIKPIIEVSDGEVIAAGKVRTRSKALKSVADRAMAADIEELCIMHSMAPDLESFTAMTSTIAPPGGAIVSTIGAVVGVHTGPGVAGLVWLEKPK
jgi:DegV family protein with EDD domain